MFSRPTLAELVTRTRADMLARLTPEELLRRSDSEVLARVMAGASHELHGYLDWIANQVIYDTADEDMLVRWASIWGIEQKPAEFAEGFWSTSGVAATVVPAESVLRRSDGVEYRVTADTALASGATDIPVEAVEAGASGNALAGTPLSLLSPIAGVQSVGVVGAAGLVNGSDVESVDELRDRFLERIRKPVSGGAASDYEAWALEVPGVTRAWVYPLEMGAGTVTVRFVRDNDVSIIPDGAEVAAVKAHIDTLRPVTAELYVVAPVAAPINFQIQLTPASLAVKAAVEAELRDLLKREAAPGKTILVSHIREAISIAAGEEDHVLVSPSANVTHPVGSMSTFGSITWV